MNRLHRLHPLNSSPISAARTHWVGRPINSKAKTYSFISRPYYFFGCLENIPRGNKKMQNGNRCKVCTREKKLFFKWSYILIKKEKYFISFPSLSVIFLLDTPLSFPLARSTSPETSFFRLQNIQFGRQVKAKWIF